MSPTVMKLKRRTVWVTFVASVLVACGVAVWWGTRPTPYQGMVETLALGLSEAEVLRLVAALPAAQPTEGPMRFTVPSRFAVWVGRIDGMEYRLAQQDRADDAILGRPLWHGLQAVEHVEIKAVRRDGVGVCLTFTDNRSGQVMAKCWALQSAQECLCLYLGPDGRLAEKVYGRVQEESWRDRAKAFLGGYWPY